MARLTAPPETIAAAISRRFGGRFVWGESDCVSAVALTLADLGAAAPRPRLWRSAAEARELLASLGGLEAALERVLRREGWARIAGTPEALDVGILRREGVETTALFDGRAWAAKAARGWVSTTAPAQVLWRRF